MIILPKELSAAQLAGMAAGIGPLHVYALAEAQGKTADEVVAISERMERLHNPAKAIIRSLLAHISAREARIARLEAALKDVKAVADKECERLKGQEAHHRQVGDDIMQRAMAQQLSAATWIRGAVANIVFQALSPATPAPKEREATNV